MKSFTYNLAAFVMGFSAFCGMTNAQTATQTARIQLNPAASIVVPSSVTLANSGTAFSNYQGTLNLGFLIRTTPTGTGSLTLQATEFSPTSGPTVSSGDLVYTCGASSIGAACSSSSPTTVSTSTATSVVSSFGSSRCTGNGCSGSNPQSVQVNFTVINSPQHSTGTYTSTLTFTISAT